MTDTPTPDELAALSEAATAMDLTTAEEHDTGTDGWFVCPLCQGEGEVLGEQFINIDGVAANIMFSGIGSEFGANRDFVLALIAAYRSGALVHRDELAALTARAEAREADLLDMLEDAHRLWLEADPNASETVEAQAIARALSDNQDGEGEA